MHSPRHQPGPSHWPQQNCLSQPHPRRGVLTSFPCSTRLSFPLPQAKVNGGAPTFDFDVHVIHIHDTLSVPSRSVDLEHLQAGRGERWGAEMLMLSPG